MDEELRTDIHFTIVPDGVIHAELSGYAKLVYLCIASHVTKGKPVAWPGRKRLQELSGFGKTVVDRAVKELEAAGWITVARETGSVNHYTVHQAVSRTGPRDGRGVSARRTGGVRETDPKYNQEEEPKKKNSSLAFDTPSEHCEPPPSAESCRYGAYWENRSKLAGNISYPVEFERWWESYPRPVDKKGTLRRWARTLRRGGGTVEELHRAARGYRKAHEGTERQYLKHSTTFLGDTEPWRDFLTVRDAHGEIERVCPHCGNVDPTGGREEYCLECGRRFDGTA